MVKNLDRDWSWKNDFTANGICWESEDIEKWRGIWYCTIILSSPWEHCLSTSNIERNVSFFSPRNNDAVIHYFIECILDLLVNFSSINAQASKIDHIHSNIIKLCFILWYIRATKRLQEEYYFYHSYNVDILLIKLITLSIELSPIYFADVCGRYIRSSFIMHTFFSNTH